MQLETVLSAFAPIPVDASARAKVWKSTSCEVSGG